MSHLFLFKECMNASICMHVCAVYIYIYIYTLNLYLCHRGSGKQWYCWFQIQNKGEESLVAYFRLSSASIYISLLRNGVSHAHTPFLEKQI